MARHAARTLAWGWWRGMRRWWIGTAVVLALVQVLLLSVAGVFSGMEQATQERVSAFYTGDLRVTPGAPAAAPDVYWNATEAEEVRRTLEAAGGTATARLESQFVLSRRTLLEAYLEEDEQYLVRTPGGTTTDTDFYSLGIVAGIETEGPAADPLRPYLLPGGRLPAPRTEVVELAMGEDTFLDFVGKDKGAFTTWPPPTAELEAIRFEITSGRIDPNSAIKDLVRRQARVVGLFATGLDALDAFTLVAHRDAVATLVQAGERPVNAFTVHGTPPPVETLPATWGTEDADAFAGRYIGQMVDVVRALGLFLAVLFVALPLFLVWHGLGQLLQMHHREYAVCRAIGVGPRTLGSGILRLVVALALLAVLLATLGALAVAALADPFLGRLDLPLPVSFHLPLGAVVATLVAVAVALAIAVLAALRRVVRQDLPAALRAA